jgi:DNA helicase HerA-like ATPase
MDWFSATWDNYRDPEGPFEKAKKAKGGREWADEDLQTLMRFLTRKAKPGGNPSESGFRKLIAGRDLHTASLDESFENEIVVKLRKGEVVLIDLSQGDPKIQRTYSDRVCRRIFGDAMKRFIENEPANFIQMYFEEAHNLFPRREERDLTIVYNRLAKEGQKLKLGLAYATQEVSSISSSILKNTQNWFVAHLNNRDELKELDKYYDFEDFTDSLRRTTDRGFIRMKTDSNTFIVPVQIDQFRVAEAN